MKIWRRVIPPHEFVSLLEQFIARLDSTAHHEGVPVVHHRLCRADSAQSQYFLDPVHLTGRGNRILAEDVATALAAEAATIFAPGDAPP